MLLQIGIIIQIIIIVIVISVCYQNLARASMALGKVAENMTVCLSGRQLSRTRITCKFSLTPICDFCDDDYRISRLLLFFPTVPEVQSPCQTSYRLRQGSSSLSVEGWSPTKVTKISQIGQC